MLLFLPPLVQALYFFCNDQQCVSLNPWNPAFLQAKSVEPERDTACCRA